MDQSVCKVPWKPKMSKDQAQTPSIKFHINLVDINGTFSFFFVDAGQIPHDPNLTIHCLMEALEIRKREGSLGKSLFLQVDNTCFSSPPFIEKRISKGKIEIKNKNKSQRKQKQNLANVLCAVGSKANISRSLHRVSACWSHSLLA